MKRLLAPILSMLIGLMLVAVPHRAAAASPVDCTAGCTIVTRHEATSLVWQCDRQGCTRVGQYTQIIRPQVAPAKAEPELQGQAQAFDQVCDGKGKQACAMKVCDGPTCTVSAFDGKHFIPVGKRDNIDYLIEQATK